MVHPFISTQPIRFHFGEAALSFITHGGLIAVAVTTSGLPARTAAIAPQIASEYVRFITSPLRPSMTSPARRVDRKSAARPLVANPMLRQLADVQLALNPGAVVPAIDIDAGVPAVDFASLLNAGNTEPIVFARSVLGRGAFLPKGAHNAYEEHVVQRAVFSRRGNPKPDYPSALRRTGVEASFMVQFVVDSTGHVDKNAIDFLEPAQKPFLDAVRRALLRSYYYAAEMDGRPVRQLVRQRFIFKIER